MIKNRSRKWVLYLLGALFVLQIYFVQELVSALLVFVLAFAAIALLAAVVFLLHEGGQRAIEWLEAHVRSGYALSSRAVALAAELSKKPFRRPHSPPAP